MQSIMLSLQPFFFFDDLIGGKLFPVRIMDDLIKRTKVPFTPRNLAMNLLTLSLLRAGYCISQSGRSWILLAKAAAAASAAVIWDLMVVTDSTMLVRTVDTSIPLNGAMAKSSNAKKKKINDWRWRSFAFWAPRVWNYRRRWGSQSGGQKGQWRR